MLVWGGTNGTALNSGGSYDPFNDSWTPTSVGLNVPTARSEHTAVWTGNEMIIWGGSLSGGRALADGSRYAPLSNSWSAIKPDLFKGTTLPALRGHVAVWTGSEMVVWGGNSGKSFTNIGARYEPSTGAWTSTSTINAPRPRAEASAVWTGTEMIVWGGTNSYGDLDSGGRYCASGVTRDFATPE